MTSAQTVFDIAIKLMDEQDEATGATKTQDTAEYEHRTIDILNSLRHECYLYSDTFTPREDGKRPICRGITSLSDALDLDDAIAQGALPYGLASRLLLGENDSLASFFQQLYEEKLALFGRTCPAQFESIPLYYGGLN